MASRRQQNSTHDTPSSIASSIIRDAQISFEYLAATDLEQLPPLAVLERTLSIRSVISTTSSFAHRSQAARDGPAIVNVIGEGLQGVVFEQLGDLSVMKKEKPGNSLLPTNLKHEFEMHVAVLNAFFEYKHKVGNIVRVPHLTGFKPKDGNDKFWDDHLSQFPEGYRTKNNIIQMERILPLPKVIRKALISHFYPYSGDSTTRANTVERILNEVDNKHALARTYFGKMDGTRSINNFSLGNFPLYLNSMVQLRMDIHGLVSSLAKAFAIMHWGAGINGDDVEFVLGSFAMRDEEAEDELYPFFQHRGTGIFLLDFGQCESVDLSQDQCDVYQAFKGAMVTGDNQNFIPHYKKTPELFATFKQVYIESGTIILAAKNMDKRYDLEDFMVQYEEYAEDFLL